MSIIALLDLRVCWDKDTKSSEFVNTSLSLVNGEEHLIDVIKREVRKKMIDESRIIDYQQDIKSAKNADGKDVSNILKVPLSLSIKKFKNRHDDEIEITVVLDKPAPAASSSASNPAANEELPKGQKLITNYPRKPAGHHHRLVSTPYVEPKLRQMKIGETRPLRPGDSTDDMDTV
jgi:hypothetical protein